MPLVLEQNPILEPFLASDCGLIPHPLEAFGLSVLNPLLYPNPLPQPCVQDTPPFSQP